MTQVRFDAVGTIPDEEIIIVALMARHRDKWVFVRQHGRATWEIPGGHREPGEDPDAAARPRCPLRGIGGKTRTRA
ncbi:MAG: NUDIX domain-containing protein [Patescibacteria group bacterium]